MHRARRLEHRVGIQCHRFGHRAPRSASAGHRTGGQSLRLPLDEFFGPNNQAGQPLFVPFGIPWFRSDSAMEWRGATETAPDMLWLVVTNHRLVRSGNYVAIGIHLGRRGERPCTALLGRGVNEEFSLEAVRGQADRMASTSCPPRHQ